MLRIMFAGYIIYLVTKFHESMPKHILALNLISFLALTTTYSLMNRKKSGVVGWSWVHSVNCIIFFANFWNCVYFWVYSKETSNPVIVRMNCAPALAVFNNMFITDWQLLDIHSHIF